MTDEPEVGSIAWLEDLADDFYGEANTLAYSAGPERMAPMDTWPAEKRVRWSRLITIATLISDLADEMAGDDEPGVTLPVPTITEEDG